MTLQQSHPVHFDIFDQGHRVRLRPSRPMLDKWAESDEEVIVSMSVSSDRWTRYVLVVVDKSTWIPRVVSLKSSLTTNESRHGNIQFPLFPKTFLPAIRPTTCASWWATTEF
ncbi:hypothetical protein DL93DRAFT_2092245 [Clavulina sp. PMI_390]|nr:hypothetical protein DL93DRAFT_2092245 [Clavulina sp. PMI_390]